LLYDAKRQLETVQEIVRAVEVHAKLPSYLHSILDLTLEKVGARDGTIQLLDKTTNELVVRARAGKLAQRSHEYERIPLSKGITGRAARDRQMVYVSNIEQADDYLAYIEGTRSEIAIPMTIGRDQPGGGRLIGVLNVESPVADAFKPYSRGLLERIADQAAVLIQQKMEAEELEARRLAAEVSAGVGMVTAEVAHHVKNLAGIIRVCDQRLSTQLSGLTTQQREDLDIILQNAQGIMEAADDLFKPYKPEPKAEVSIGLILGEALSVVGIQPDIGIQVNLAPDLPRVLVQAQKIQSYIVEILDNAIKFTRRRLKEEMLQRGQVEVNGTCVSGNIIELAFTNHGPAIPRERWEEIFKLFSTDEQGQGESQSYGLGLWGARTTLRLHGGDVYVLESNTNQTTFLMRLPVQQERGVMV
jgi:signal transduction histidine kinase